MTWTPALTLGLRQQKIATPTREGRGRLHPGLWVEEPARPEKGEGPSGHPEAGAKDALLGRICALHILLLLACVMGEPLVTRCGPGEASFGHPVRSGGDLRYPCVTQSRRPLGTFKKKRKMLKFGEFSGSKVARFEITNCAQRAWRNPE